MGWKKITALVLAVMGVIVLQLGAHQHTNGKHEVAGIVLIIAAVCCEACYTLMGKALTRSFDPVEITAFSGIIALAGFALLSITQWPQVHLGQIALKSWLYLIAYGAGTLGLGSVLWYKGLKQVQGSEAAAFMGVMPVSALVLSYMLLGEQFHWMHLAGFAFSFAGVLLMISVHREMR